MEEDSMTDQRSGGTRMMTRTLTTTSSAAGMWHRWTVTNGSQQVDLSALRTMHMSMPGVPQVARHLTARAAGNGVWVFDVISIVRDGDADALGTDHARAAWDLIVAAGVADIAVWATLETLHAQVFGGGR